MHLCSTNYPRPARKGQHKPKRREQKDTLSSSRVRRLFDGDPQMTENGRRPHSKGNHTGDFRLAAASNEAFCNKSVSSPTMNKYLKDGASFWKETEENAFCLSLWCYIRDQAKAWLSSPAPHCANLAPGRLMGWLQRTNSRSKRTHGIGREGERYLFLVACAAARLLSLSPPHIIFMT